MKTIKCPQCGEDEMVIRTVDATVGDTDTAYCHYCDYETGEWDENWDELMGEVA